MKLYMIQKKRMARKKKDRTPNRQTRRNASRAAARAAFKKERSVKKTVEWQAQLAAEKEYNTTRIGRSAARRCDEF
jgi:hypothetical protein